MKTKIWLAALLVLVTSVNLGSGSAHATVLVTELSSKSTLAPGDYFELTNTGAAPADVTGWQFDDESADILDAVPLNGITTIAPGESVVFFQLDETDSLEPAYDPAGEVALFRGYWGGLSGVQVGWHAGAGLGKGDAITLFDSSDAQVISFEYGMTTPNQTHAGDWAAGNTDGSDLYENGAAVWVPGSSPQQFVLSAAGVYDSFANTGSEYGSPGVVGQVPEPGTITFAGLAFLVMTVMYRRK